MKIITMAALALVGCCTKPASIVVKVPVPVRCLGQVPARPVPTFGSGAYLGEKWAAQAALADAAAWERYSVLLEAAQAGCDKGQ